MKKVLLIEDRFPRQALFMRETKIDLEQYSHILDNVSNGDEVNLFELTIKGEFDYAKYDYVLCHKSIFNGDNSQFISLLKKYTQENNISLILFSGGVSVNYYSSNPHEILELNSKTFYSQNLKLFLDAIEKGNENILMLCYGQNWKLSILSNSLEKINLFIAENLNKDRIVYNNFINEIEIAKIEKINQSFYDVVVNNGWVSIEEIIKFRDSLYDYFQNGGTTSLIKKQKTLLIHNFNVDLELFSSQIMFDTEDKQIDKYISTDLLEEIKQEEFDMIFIKDNLSSSYFELYGLIVAYHIRLSSSLPKYIRDIPIVIISDFDSKILNQFSTLAKILFTKNIFIIKNTKEAIEEFSTKEFKAMTDEEYREDFLDIIELKAPNESSHDISNEWAIYRWAELLKVESEAIKTNRDKISSMLYFKYLLAKNPIDKQRAIGYKKPKLSGKVLYIDDEWAKGWSDIFKSYFPSNIEFKTFEKNFKDVNIFSLKVELKEYVISYEPDIVLLDLRLVAKDHTREEIENLTGIKITQMIKEINPAIQVIIFTATNKSRILEKLYEEKILGYIKKVHPEDKNLTTKDSFAKLAELVDIGLEKKYLKEIWTIQNSILELNIFKKEDKTFKKVEFEITTIFEILDSNVENKLKFTLITIFKVLEILTGKYNLIGNEYEKNIKLFHNNGLKKYDKDISQIVCTRNFLVHDGNIETLHYSCKKDFIETPNQDNILIWFKMLQTILKKVSFDKVN